MRSTGHSPSNEAPTLNQSTAVAIQMTSYVSFWVWVVVANSEQQASNLVGIECLQHVKLECPPNRSGKYPGVGLYDPPRFSP